MARESLQEEFKATIETAVRPILEGPGRPIYAVPGLRAELTTTVGNVSVGYMLFRDQAPQGASGINGLRFMPTHALEIVARQPFFGTTSGQAMFGLSREGAFARNLRDNRTQASVTRELADDEVEALVAFAKSPAIALGELAVILGMNDEEHAVFTEGRASHQEMVRELQAGLREIEEAERI